MLAADWGEISRQRESDRTNPPIGLLRTCFRLRAYASEAPQDIACECLHLVIGFTAGSVGGNAFASRECANVSCPRANRRPESNSKGPEVLFDAPPFVTTPVDANRHNNHLWTGPSSE